MCHRSVGLVQQRLEAAGIATVTMITKRDISAGVGTSRGAFVRFPLGSPLGEPHKPEQQRAVLTAALALLEQVEEPGTIVEMSFRWRRM